MDYVPSECHHIYCNYKVLAAHSYYYQQTTCTHIICIAVTSDITKVGYGELKEAVLTKLTGAVTTIDYIIPDEISEKLKVEDPIATCTHDEVSPSCCIL